MIIAYTGHRPDNPNMGGYNIHSPKNNAIGNDIRRATAKVLVENGQAYVSNRFIFGGAIGTDQLAFEHVFGMYECGIMHDNTVFEIAVPFKNQPNKWSEIDKMRYFDELNTASIVTYVDTIEKYKVPHVSCNIFHPLKFIKRNEYMVDKCDVLIATWDGRRSGGTWRTVEYARKVGKPVVIVDPKKVEVD